MSKDNRPNEIPVKKIPKVDSPDHDSEDIPDVDPDIDNPINPKEDTINKD